MAPLTRWERLMVFYGASHRHPVNIAIHVVCVPIILFGATVPMGWVALPGGLALSWLFLGFAALGYATLDKGLTLGLLPVLVAIGLGVDAVAALPRSTGALIGAGAFVGGYLAQFVGHAIEGKKPSLLDNFVLAQVSAPLFVVAEVAQRLGLRKALFARVEAALSAGGGSAG